MTIKAKKPARKVTARKPAARKPAARKPVARKPVTGTLDGLTKAEQSAAIAKSMKQIADKNTVTLYSNAAGYNAIPQAYKGALIIAVFEVLGMVTVTAAGNVTKGKRTRTNKEFGTLLTSSVVSHWTGSSGLLAKDTQGKYSVTAKGLNNLSGRMNKLHAGRALTSYGIDGIDGLKDTASKALQDMRDFVTKGIKPAACPKMISTSVKIAK